MCFHGLLFPLIFYDYIVCSNGMKKIKYIIGIYNAIVFIAKYKAFEWIA